MFISPQYRPFSRSVVDATAAIIQDFDPSGLPLCDEAR
jgi:hypothetical protein